MQENEQPRTNPITESQFLAWKRQKMHRLRKLRQQGDVLKI